MFKKPAAPTQTVATPVERVTSVLGPGIIWSGNLAGKGGIRIEGTFEGEVAIRGLVVIGETGRLTCRKLKANNVIVAGAVKGNIFSEKLEIRSTGRVWGDVVTTAFATEEGAFLRGQVRMEETVELGFEAEKPVQAIQESSPEDTSIPGLEENLKDKDIETPEVGKKIRKIASSK
jgi:cytoskeletal protein CcmA (bactofilin family)